MERYRLYGQTDDQPKVVGDEHFLGVDEYSNPENVQPAYVQKAVNLAFNTMNAETRGGFVCLPELGDTPFGTDWSSQTVGATINWKAVTYGNGLFVAVGVASSGYGAVMTSPDGITWTQQIIFNAPAFNAVAYGDGLYVAVGNPYALATTGIRVSADGITWTEPASNSTSAINGGVAYGNGIWAVLAFESPDKWYVYKSTNNGITWTKTLAVTHAVGGTGCIAYGNGKFVISLTYLIILYYSTDAVTWTGSQLVNPAPGGLLATSIVYGKNNFYVLNMTGDIYASPNGINWTKVRTEDAVFNSWRAMSSCDEGLLVAGQAGGGTLSSLNGTAWNRTYTVPSLEFYGAACNNDLYVLVGDSGAVATSYSPIMSIYGSGLYSDPNSVGTQWIVLVGASQVGFYQNGQASRKVSLGGYEVDQQSTIVQCNNLVYLFRGENAKPLYWNGDWNTTFQLVPDTTLPASFNSIPNSNQAVYYQNRLWVRDGKDSIAASDVLAFNDYDPLANEFNLNTGNSDYVVATFPFGQNSLICFKNKSIQLMQNVEGSLSDVTVTEITRQVGLVGINAVTSVGPDLAYVSYGNINMLTLTSTNNAMQHKTLPLSSRIRKIINRINWNAGYKISLGYWSNRLYVALPLDNSPVCNAVVCYNFITESWYGEWNFADTMNMCIQGWQVADYLGLQRLHAITEDGRILVTDEGQNDISGTVLAEISTEMVTRAYATQGNSSPFSVSHFQRRMFADLATNRPKFSASSYTEGASEETVLVTDQTYSRSQSWKFNDSSYSLNNANNDYNRAYRKDYSTGPDSVQTGTGFLPEMTQDYRLPVLTNRAGRLSWLKISNTQGYMMVKSIGLENRLGQRGSTIQV